MPEQEALSVSEVLSRAADLLEKPGAWTQHTWARDADGEPDATPGADVCWCLYGALRRAGNFYAPLTEQAFKAVSRVVGDDVIDWNDAPGRTQAEVVSALRAASEASQ